MLRSAWLIVLFGAGCSSDDGAPVDAAIDETEAATHTEIAFITRVNALGGHELHVVGPDGAPGYIWGNHDYVYTGNAIDLDTSDSVQRIAIGGGQGNINNKVLLFDYQGNKQWEVGANGNAQGTRFYQGYLAKPIIAVGYHDNTFVKAPGSSVKLNGLGFYARDLSGTALAWHPQFPDGGGTAPFKGGAWNVWHSYADEVNHRLFVMGEFSSTEKTDGSASGVPASRIAVYQQASNGSFPQVPTRMAKLGASWFVTTATTPLVGNPWTMVQTPTYYYIGGQCFDTAQNKAGSNVAVSSLARVRVSDLDLDSTWRPQLAPNTHDTNTCAMVRELAIYGNEILVAGRFTSFEGHARQHLAAIDKATGAITDRFANVKVVGGDALSITVDGDRAYIGGNFTSVTDANGSHARKQLACIDLTTNLVTAWNPSPGEEVRRVRAIHIH